MNSTASYCNHANQLPNPDPNLILTLKVISHKNRSDFEEKISNISHVELLMTAEEVSESLWCDRSGFR